MQQQKASVSMSIVVWCLVLGSTLAVRNQVGDFNGGISDLDVSHQKSCTVDSGFDRWITVTPELSDSKHFKQWFSSDYWEEKIGKKEKVPQFTYEPFVLRNRTSYRGRMLVKTGTRPPGGDECIATYTVVCDPVHSVMRLIKRETCGLNAATEQSLKFDTFHKKYVFCAEAGDEDGADAKRVFVFDDGGHARPVKTGNCVKIEPVNPTKGIHLNDIDPILMGKGFWNDERKQWWDDGLLGGNESKLDEVKAMVEYAVENVLTNIVFRPDEAEDLKHDLIDIYDEGKEDIMKGAVVAGKTSLKWVKRVLISSMVHACLCCDQKGKYERDEHLADHCKAAYTMGGQNKSNPMKFLAKATLGTAFSMVKRAGNWVVPILGGLTMVQGHRVVCALACEMREPRFEQYKYSRNARVPGLSVRMFWVPNPGVPGLR